MNSDELDKMDYDIGGMTTLMLIIKEGISLVDIEVLMYDKIEEFKKNYGIEEYDNIERLLLDD